MRNCELQEEWICQLRRRIIDDGWVLHVYELPERATYQPSAMSSTCGNTGALTDNVRDKVGAPNVACNSMKNVQWHHTICKPDRHRSV